ncbi:MAG: sigma-54 dependent transcriptional regulator [Puniceicoccales bacterium]|jgi:DNA-binding NtrC family response regulator|nr:sigma-54 dependent transcriptional regulator [Puniceicoccales bacterium]
MQFDKVLIIDDELVIRKALEEQLRNLRYTVASVSKLTDAENVLGKDNFDLVFLDVRLPDGDGTRLLKHFNTLPENVEKPITVVITGYGSIESAVECMKLGAFDYIIKPFSLQEIEVVLKKAESYSHLVKVNQFFSCNSAEGDLQQELLGEGPVIQHIKALIKKVASTEATVLITGENGTGKELVAREIHRLSHLASRPYITVNCAAIAENLIESEFFGHEKGAFTHALQKRIGRFELANNGTILLDEIAEISPHLQAKLLRVLQEKEFERVGGTKTLKVNTRVIASTNRDLSKSVERGDFREDLFYRLNVFPIEIPPLRERGNDILLLANYFLKRYTRKHGITLNGFSDEAKNALLVHKWPGNVRELQNTIERAVILSNDQQEINERALNILPNTHVNTTLLEDPTLDLEAIEKKHILHVLNTTHGNRTKAASLLKISTRTLSNKLKQYALAN